jgi:hypothetical protein
MLIVVVDGVCEKQEAPPCKWGFFSREFQMSIYAEPTSAHPIEAIVYEFVSDLEGLRTASHLTGRIMQATAEKASHEYEAFIKDVEQEIVVDPKTGVSRTLLAIPTNRRQEFSRLESSLKRTMRSVTLVPRNFVVSLISTYDVFVSKLVQTIFAIKPECLNQSERVIKVSELLAAGSREDLILALTDDEVETLLRKSHQDQFTWLENRFHVVLRKGLNVWPEFIEVTQRRNLFVHSDGRVSKQYLDICRSEGVLLDPNLAVGQQLNVNRSYVEKVFATILEIGVKLAQVLWRKHDPANIREADWSLNELSVRLIDERKFELSKRLLDFACEVLPRLSSRETKLYFIINRALAWKLSGDEKKCQAIIDGEDWSADNVRFQLALAALKDDLQTTLKLMRAMGKDGPVKVSGYQLWPLFRKFRGETEFVQTFEEIFEIPLIETKKIDAPLLKKPEGDPENPTLI